MATQKLGKAKFELESELWALEGGRAEKFLMNQRLINARPDVKSLRASYAKIVNGKKPRAHKRRERDEYFAVRDERKDLLNQCLEKAYEEILQESFSYPIPLRRDRDYDHKGDWRYCLYKGYVYQFDKPGCSDAQMLEQIHGLETKITNKTKV